MDKVHVYENQLDQELSKLPQLRQIEAATGVKKTYLVAGVGFFSLLLIFFNIAGQLLTNLVGFAFPAYASFKAIQTSRKDDDTQWLTYWTVFASFSIVETMLETILYWFPFYYLVKLVFLLWLYLPQFRGAEFLYKTVILPRLSANEAKIDAALDKVKSKAQVVADQSKTE